VITGDVIWELIVGQFLYTRGMNNPGEEAGTVANTTPKDKVIITNIKTIR
jgi:hypothetical protein